MKSRMKDGATAVVAGRGTLAAHTQAGDNVTTVGTGGSTLTTVFGTIFALGVAVVIALIAKKSSHREV